MPWAKPSVLVAALGVALVSVSCTGGSSRHFAERGSIPPTSANAVLVARPPSSGFLSLPYTTSRAGGNGHDVVVWNWDGDRQAVVHTGPVADCCTTVALAPDGTRLQVLDRQGAQVVDLHRRVLFQSNNLPGIWADDSRDRCTFHLHPNSARDRYDGPTDLVLIDQNGNQHTIARVGSEHPHGGPAVLRCSIADNQAIVTDSLFGSVSQVWQVKLTTGTVSRPSWLPTDATGLEQLAISGDGKFAAVSRFSGGNEQTDVIDTDTGKVVSVVYGAPLAMSWDGHIVVLQREVDIAAIDWRSHTLSWHSRPTTNTTAGVSVAARMNSDDLALSVWSQPGQQYRQAELWLIPARSPARLLAPDALFGII